MPGTTSVSSSNAGRAGSGGQLRAAGRGQAANALDRIRRQGAVDVSAGDDDARDPRALGRDLRGRSQRGVISQVTEAVLEEVKAWQSRPLEAVHPIMYLDALYVKMRHEGRVENRAVHVAIGITLEGRKEVLGLWTNASEGAKFWLGILTELRNRGVRDIFIACVDGLKGFPQAIESVFSQAQVQLCIVHLMRASLHYVNWKDRKQVAAALKPIYRAATVEQARRELESFVEVWGGKYQAIGRLWREQWEWVIPFFAFAPEIRKVIYTTNAVESLHMSLRKVIKNRGSFPSEESAIKRLFLALRNASAKWDIVQHWRQALNQFEILWGDRLRNALSAA